MEQNTFTDRTHENVSVAESISANPITPIFADLSPQSPEKISASNSAISANSAHSASTHKANGDFAPGHPWRFQPGQSGNPKGRPRRKKVRPLSEVLQTRLAQPVPDAPETSYAEFLGDLILKSALDGNIRAINALFDRTEGRPRQPIGIQAPSLVDSEEWIKLREAICGAIEPFPEVQAAVLKAIDEMEDDDDTD